MVGEKTLCFSSQCSNPFTYLFGLNRNAKASSGWHYLQDKIALFNRDERKSGPSCLRFWRIGVRARLWERSCAGCNSSNFKCLQYYFTTKIYGGLKWFYCINCLKYMKYLYNVAVTIKIWQNENLKFQIFSQVLTMGDIIGQLQDHNWFSLNQTFQTSGQRESSPVCSCWSLTNGRAVDVLICLIASVTESAWHSAKVTPGDMMILE